MIFYFMLGKELLRLLARRGENFLLMGILDLRQ